MDDSKTNILNAASALFLEGGIAALNVRAIAARAGISTIGIYSHFQGKQGILDALYIAGFQRVAQAMDIPDAARAPAAAVLQACQNYLETAQQYAAHYQLIFGDRDSGYEPSDDAKLVGAMAFKVLTDLVANLLPSGASKAVRHDAAIQVWSVVHGFVGLRQHAVAQLVDMRRWKARALATLRIVVDSIANGQLRG